MPLPLTFVFLLQVLSLVRRPGESDEQLLRLHLLVGVSGQPQQDLRCRSVTRARVEIETMFGVDIIWELMFSTIHGIVTKSLDNCDSIH